MVYRFFLFFGGEGGCCWDWKTRTPHDIESIISRRLCRSDIDAKIAIDLCLVLVGRRRSFAFGCPQLGRVFTEFSRCFLPDLNRFHLVVPSCIRTYWTCMGFTVFYRVLLGFIGFYRVLSGFTRYHLMLLSITGLD